MRRMTRTPTDRFDILNVWKLQELVQIDELVDPEKQQFLQDKAMKAETKDIVVEGREDTRSRKEKREEEEEDLDPVINSESLKVET